MGKIYVLRAGKPVMVRVHTGITDGRSTAVSGEGLAAGDKVIVSELQSDNAPNKGQQGNNNGPRGPRMF